jgi:hypothetical protein
MSARKASRVATILQGLRSAGIVVRKVYVYEKEMHVCCINGEDSWTCVFRLGAYLDTNRKMPGAKAHIPAPGIAVL